MVTAGTKRRFTVKEYYRMGRAGIFGPCERVELLDGEIYEMAPLGDRHAGCCIFLDAWFNRRLLGRALVDVQNPVRLGPRSEPQPDLMLLTPREDYYRTGHPTPADVLLLIEVSDTTLRYDRLTKLPRYATAGIPETWIVNLKARQVEVYRAPSSGVYQQRLIFQGDDTLAPLAFPELVLRAGEIIG